MSNESITTLVDGVLALAIIASSAVLLALSKIDGTTALALFGVAITMAGGSAKALLALRVPVPSQTVIAPAVAQTTTTTTT